MPRSNIPRSVESHTVTFVAHPVQGVRRSRHDISSQPLRFVYAEASYSYWFRAMSKERRRKGGPFDFQGSVRSPLFSAFEPATLSADQDERHNGETIRWLAQTESTRLCKRSSVASRLR